MGKLLPPLNTLTRKVTGSLAGAWAVGVAQPDKTMADSTAEVANANLNRGRSLFMGNFQN
jgi:hypothetical protein